MLFSAVQTDGLRLKGEIFMDANRMKRELGGGAVFPIELKTLPTRNILRVNAI